MGLKQAHKGLPKEGGKLSSALLLKVTQHYTYKIEFRPTLPLPFQTYILLLTNNHFTPHVIQIINIL